MLNSAKYIMQVLINNGYSAYLVGGCVRDSIIGIPPKDYDIATNAIPDIVEKLFCKTIPTGKQYGTITVMIDGIGFEVTTFRKDSEYADGRRPNKVKFANTIEEDLSRRDFTMNAMAMDINGNIIDPFGGVEDIKRGVIKFVGNAYDRLEEDRLRAFRLIRFMSVFGMKANQFEITELLGLDISKISMERIREEFNKILVSKNPRIGIYTLCETGLFDDIFPELIDCIGFEQNNPNHSETVFNHIISVVENVEPILELRLSALFHDIGKPDTYSVDENGVGHFYSHHKASAEICKDVMKRFKYSNKEIEDVSELVYWHMSRYDHLRTPSIKKFINKVGVERLDNLFKLQIADIQSSENRSDISTVIDLKNKCYEVINAQLPMSLKDLAINGHDLISLGYSGKEIGEQLLKLLDLVLEDDTINIKEKLIELSVR